tara:strand:- start:50 stop:262 length:213 start_codon:yes stop_codon:yes gene_type:complete
MKMKGGNKTGVKKKVVKKKEGQKTKVKKPMMMRNGMKTKKMGRGKSTDMGKGIENFQNMVTRLYGGGKTK